MLSLARPRSILSLLSLVLSIPSSIPIGID